MERLNINEEKQMFNNENFLSNIKEALSDFDGLSLEYVVETVRSDEFKIQKEIIEKSFWSFFDCISKDDDSLDACIYLQKYGFTIANPAKEDELIILEDIYEDEDDEDE
jgi:hypothetical protein